MILYWKIIKWNKRKSVKEDQSFAEARLVQQWCLFTVNFALNADLNSPSNPP